MANSISNPIIFSGDYLVEYRATDKIGIDDYFQKVLIRGLTPENIQYFIDHRKKGHRIVLERIDFLKGGIEKRTVLENENRNNLFVRVRSIVNNTINFFKKPLK